MSAQRFIKRRHERGYTVVEVMSAMTLFAIGAAGVISMQRVTIQGGDDARRMDVASNLAQEWGYRLQRDSAFWTEPNTLVATSNLATATKWLKDASTLAAGVTGNWTKPDTTAGYRGLSGEFDMFGDDVPANSNPVFCAQYRFTWITFPNGATSTARPLLRADIRVYWPRLDTAPLTTCFATNAGPAVADNDKYHFVYLSTTIRPTASQ